MPARREATAQALHYDAPSAAAPQSLLLAVAPEIGRPWDADTLRA